MNLRRLSSSFILIFCCFIFLPIFSQDECKILIPQLNGEYKGKCKKGFAHGKGYAKGVDTYEGTFRSGLPDGKGEYTWSTGERYVGEYVEGKRDGLGIYYYVENNEDMVQEGMWIDDAYAGPVPERPKVISSTGIERYSFQRQGDGNRVQITPYLNGQNNTDLEGLTFYGSSGGEFRSGGTLGYQAIVFPFQCKISYYSWNKMHTVRTQSRFEFEITQPGKWQVVLHNN